MNRKILWASVIVLMQVSRLTIDLHQINTLAIPNEQTKKEFNLYNEESLSLACLSSESCLEADSARTIYYNLYGSEIKRTTGEQHTNILLLTHSRNGDHCLEKGYYLVDPGMDLIDSIRKAYQESDKGQREYFFAVGHGGWISPVLSGDHEYIPAALIADVRNQLRERNDSILLAIHTHPLLKDEFDQVMRPGNAFPSRADTIKKLGRFEFILGYVYDAPRMEPNSVMNTGQVGTYRPLIGIYSGGETIDTISLRDLEKLIGKLNAKNNRVSRK
ncbi:hypothetical protein CLV59_10886 [Chitinophaga dinghuensis]|uniref:Uncharacterized protein n=1 Tax=Chitinophaga dinghuensis TaxID=1539050 RepID=A0A327VQD7_9BACT|nr:hypothetical protein [Chitinophaga dinghuensis]RAJ76567.1 hypothetical protein CLV59_10886 [Chitinophaga dinghuensis]